MKSSPQTQAFVRVFYWLFPINCLNSIFLFSSTKMKLFNWTNRSNLLSTMFPSVLLFPQWLSGDNYTSLATFCRSRPIARTIFFHREIVSGNVWERIKNYPIFFAFTRKTAYHLCWLVHCRYWGDFCYQHGKLLRIGSLFQTKCAIMINDITLVRWLGNNNNNNHIYFYSANSTIQFSNALYNSRGNQINIPQIIIFIIIIHKSDQIKCWFLMTGENR